jgi:hypothetical protein
VRRRDFVVAEKGSAAAGDRDGERLRIAGTVITRDLSVEGANEFCDISARHSARRNFLESAK